MKLHRRNVFLVLGLAVVAALGIGLASGALCDVQKIRQAVLGEKITGLELSGAETLVSTGSHGWMGEGETFKILTLSEQGQAAAPAVLENSDHWRPYPMTWTGQYAARWVDLEEKPFFPELEEGWWFFLSRSVEGTDYVDDETLFPDDELFRNYTAAVYDPASGKLYYYELDT